MNKMNRPALIKSFAALAMLLTGCTNASDQKNPIIEKEIKSTPILPNKDAFTQSIDGKQTNLYILKNSSGMEAAITNYGGRLVSLIVPVNTDTAIDVIFGFDSVLQYKQSTEPYFGASIGRYGNRIAKGKFTLDNKTYSLFTNNGPNTLHGGKKGFQDVVWDAKVSGDSSVALSYLAKDMEEGFPGNLNVKVTYTVTANNELAIAYEARTDKKTVLNLTNHAFFNLNGSGTINDHVLMINADKYTPVDSTLIPTGQLLPVAGTPFDFRKGEKIGAHLNTAAEQLKYGFGYDHNFVLNKKEDTGLTMAAAVSGNQFGIAMEVWTTEPGLQFYGGNFMQGKNKLRGGKNDEYRTAFCLETQHFPNAPNQPNFPSTTLNPGETFTSNSVYRFYIKDRK